LSLLTNAGFVSLSPSIWHFCLACQAVLYSVFCYTEIQTVKLTARFSMVFHRVVTSNKKVVTLSCCITSTSKIVTYFPGEHQVACGFPFLFFFFFLSKGKVRGRLWF